MKISYIGQLGLPGLAQAKSAPREQRAAAVAQALTAEGHDVTVYGTPPYLATGSFKGIQLVQVPSFDPRYPGGLLYLAWSLAKLLFRQQDVVHLEGIKAAFLARFIWALLPHRTWVVTIDQLPKRSWLTRHIVRFALAINDQLTAPTRELQYRLLNEFRVQAEYVPDGIRLETRNQKLEIRELPQPLTTNKYLVLLGEDSKALRAFAKAAKQAKLKQRLAVVGEETPALKRLTKQFPKVKLVGAVGNRQLRSLLAHSAGVVLVDATTPGATVLTAMSQAKPLVAVPAAHYQELLGTTARFVWPSDTPGMAVALQEQVSDRKAELKARAARTRAQRHFTWERIAAEYLQAYRGHELTTVPLDSVRPVKFTEAPVY